MSAQPDLAEIEARLADSYSKREPGFASGFDWAEAMRDIRTLIHEVELRDSDNAIVAIRIKQLQEALREAHGILQYNLGDADPHVRSACDLMWKALA